MVEKKARSTFEVERVFLSLVISVELFLISRDQR